MVDKSATYPINNGPTAPPIGDIIKKEEARFDAALDCAQPLQGDSKNRREHNRFKNITQEQGTF